MLLVIDAGNSFVKWGYHDGRDWVDQQRAGLGAFCAEPARFLERHAAHVMISNVAGKPFEEALLRAMPNLVISWVKAQDSACGIRNQYDFPAQLGSDRWAALIAAHAMCSAACLVVSVGTAMTVDMLGADGTFQGGCIVPGPQGMRAALAKRTDAVKTSNGKFTHFPTNTDDAVQTGMIYAMLGTIEQAAAAFELKQGCRVTTLLTGGAANLIAPYLNRPHQVVDNLVLEGLLLLAQKENLT